MSRKINFLNNVLAFIFTFGALFAVVYVCNQRYDSAQLIDVLIWIILGALISAVLNTFVHELGHLIAGKINGYAFSSMQVLFFKWEKVSNKVRFSLAPIKYEAGYTEMIPTKCEDIAKSYRRISLAGPFASVIFAFVGLVPFFIKGLGVRAFCMWSVFLPIGIYFHLNTVLPISSCGARNDGAVAYGLKVMDDVSKVAVGLLSAQAEMYAGKTPAQVNPKYFFDLPQLPEDDPTFIMLLSARYNYYLDIEDYENAKKTISRLASLESYMPKYILQIVKTDLLYSYCTFDYNEEKADDLMYELEKYLNNFNTATNVRVKLAYLLYVKREKEKLDIFLKKAQKEADRAVISGCGAFEKKILDKIKMDF